MYLLPVTTYFDYVRASGKFTAWAGGTLLLSLLLKSSHKGPSTEEFAFGVPIEITVDGITKEVLSRKEDPYDIINSAGIGLGANDIVGKLGNRIAITRIEERFFLQDIELPFATEKKVDFTLLPGASKVVREGQRGLRREVVKITLAGGKEVSKEITGSEIVREPRNEIIAHNPQQPVVVARGERPANLKIALEMVVEASAYTFTGNNTATGVPPRVGLIAVDPRVIPLGTRLFIEGYGPAIAADTGGGIKGYKIDLFFNTLKECLNWGRKRVKIYILQA